MFGHLGGARIQKLGAQVTSMVRADEGLSRK